MSNVTQSSATTCKLVLIWKIFISSVQMKYCCTEDQSAFHCFWQEQMSFQIHWCGGKVARICIRLCLFCRKGSCPSLPHLLHLSGYGVWQAELSQLDVQDWIRLSLGTWCSVKRTAWSWASTFTILLGKQDSAESSSHWASRHCCCWSWLCVWCLVWMHRIK